jgi:hypothetical protein
MLRKAGKREKTRFLGEYRTLIGGKNRVYQPYYDAAVAEKLKSISPRTIAGCYVRPNGR